MKTLDLGLRVDLLSMDPHFHDISIAIHRSEDRKSTSYLLNSYSMRDGTYDRLLLLAHAMRSLGGMRTAGSNQLSLQFACGQSHETALKRLFVEACKVTPGTEITPRPLWVLDKKNDLTINVEALGNGRYRCIGDRNGAREERRVASIAAGLGKLADLDVNATDTSFTCGAEHHEIVALLLTRALNVRGALREQENAANRGVLSSPSQQR